MRGFQRMAALALAITMVPHQAEAAAAAVIAATAASTATITANSASSSPQQLPQGIAGAPIEWAEVGWLTCPRSMTTAQGCAADTNWKGEKLDIEPWVDWMKRHKGEGARFMGMTVIDGRVRLFYGVPDSSEAEQ